MIIDTLKNAAASELAVLPVGDITDPKQHLIIGILTLIVNVIFKIIDRKKKTSKVGEEE